MRFIRQSTGATVTCGPFLSRISGVTPKTSLALTAMDSAVLFWQNSGTSLNLTSPLHSWVHLRSGNYDTALSASDTSRVGQLRLDFSASTVFLHVWEDFTVLAPPMYDMFVSGTTTDTSIGVTVKSGVSNPTGLTGLSGISNPTGLVGLTGISGISNPTGLTGLSGISNPTGLVGLTGISGISNPTGLVNLSGISNPTGLTGLSGISNPSVLVTDGTYSGVTWGWLSGLDSSRGGVTVVGGVSNPGGITGVSNPTGLIGLSGISNPSVIVTDGTYSGVTWGWLTGLTTSIGGVTVVGGVSNPGGITGVSNPTGLIGLSGISNPSVILTSGSYSGVTIAGVSNVTRLVTGVSNPTGLVGLTGISGISNPAVTVTAGVSNPTGLTGLSGISNPTGLTAGVSNPTGLTDLSGISNPTGVTIGLWTSPDKQQIRDALGISGTTTKSAVSGHLQIVHDMLIGRQRIHTTNNEMYFFGGSKFRGTGVTIATYDLLDSVGGATYQNVYERKIDNIV